MKTCHKCKESKALSEFHKDSRNIFGVVGTCKSCRCKHTTDWQADQKKNNLELYLKRRKSNTYKVKYGLTLEEINLIKKAQDNKCAICKTELISFVVDHCHTTGKVRGVLCSHCNIGLGNFMDDIAKLHSAIKYLNETKSN